MWQWKCETNWATSVFVYVQLFRRPRERMYNVLVLYVVWTTTTIQRYNIIIIFFFFHDREDNFQSAPLSRRRHSVYRLARCACLRVVVFTGTWNYLCLCRSLFLCLPFFLVVSFSLRIQFDCISITLHTNTSIALLLIVSEWKCVYRIQVCAFPLCRCTGCVLFAHHHHRCRCRRLVTVDIVCDHYRIAKK